MRRLPLPAHARTLVARLINHNDTTSPRVKPYAIIPLETKTVAAGIIESAFRVHRQLGPRLLESVYEACLCHELQKANFRYAAQVVLPINYNSLRLETGLRLDLLVADQVIVELKAVEALLPVHEAQILTYLKLSGRRLGLLINFNTTKLKDCIRRLVL